MIHWKWYTCTNKHIKFNLTSEFVDFVRQSFFISTSSSLLTLPPPEKKSNNNKPPTHDTQRGNTSNKHKEEKTKTLIKYSDIFLHLLWVSFFLYLRIKLKKFVLMFWEYGFFCVYVCLYVFCFMIWTKKKL